MSTKNILLIIAMTLLSPLLFAMIFFSLRIWPLWLLLIIITAVFLIFRKKNIPDSNNRFGGVKADFNNFLIRLNDSINSGTFKSFTKKLLLYPFIGIVCIAVLAIAVEFLFADYFKARSTKKEMIEIAEALSKYKYHQNKYPQNIQELIGNNPLKNEWCNDQWERPYKYSVTSDGQNFFLNSQGKDGKEDNDDDLTFDKNGETNKK